MSPAPHSAQHRPQQGTQSGSVIVWILVCVAMFAALSFTVANIMRGGGVTKNTEMMRVQANEIIGYGDTIRRAVQATRINGYSITELSFENDYISGYANPNCGDAGCRIFGSGGGGVKYSLGDEKWLDNNQRDEPLYREWFIPADSCIPNVGTGDSTCGGDAAATNEELIIFLPYIKEGVCTEINRQLGIVSSTGALPQDSGCAWGTSPVNRFTGNFIDGQSVTSFPDATLLSGRPAGCFRIGSCTGYPANTFHYYQVLLPR